MVDYIEYETEDSPQNLELIKLKKDVKFLKTLIFFFAVDLIILTIVILIMGGII